ncbi:hypothetical protein KAR91_43635 [Candidatus Pacearchaeota archaeon]|nr:hypothetical protein [Candidatus Pacearchaeota archaeon]
MLNKSTIHQICIGLRSGLAHNTIAKSTGHHISTVRKLSSTKPIRVLLPGDLHCGSNVGLTPPAYQYKYISNPKTEEHRRRNKWARLQKECWDWYVNKVTLLKPIDKAFILGDLIDGDGSRSGGTELITTDRKVQMCMAIEALEILEAGGMVMVYGTPYHTGQAEDYETDAAQYFGCKIGGHEWENINGCVFDLKHKQSNCKNPATSIWNEIVDNREWAVLGEQPKADVLVRAHIHRFCHIRIEDCIGISIPALQAYGTKFGARACSRKVQFGLVALDVWPDGEVIEHVHIAKLVEHVTHEN